MEIQMFTGTALARLRADASKNHDRYMLDHPFIHEYFSTQDTGTYCFGSTINIPDARLTIGGSDKDAENARILYEALKDSLNRTQATDRRMWAYMSHDTFWEYMINRWPVTANSSTGTILDRYFFDRGALRNGIERLYWSAALTYDDAADSYEYTDFLLSRQDLLNQMDRAFTKNKKILLPALKVLKKNGSLSEERTRQYFTRLRQAGGVTVLDAMSGERILTRCEEIYESSAEEKYVQNGCKITLLLNKSMRKTVLTVKGSAAYLGETKLPVSWNSLRRCHVGSTLSIRKKIWKIIDISI